MAEIRNEFASVWTVRDGKIAHVEFYVTNHTEALAALGLSEQDAHTDS
jgi:ketosteroid isomerase-like protein